MSEDSDKKRKCIEFAKNAENPNDLQKVEKALNSIDQEDLVEVALDAKNSNFAMKAVNKILNGNQDLLADVAKNAKECKTCKNCVSRGEKWQHFKIPLLQVLARCRRIWRAERQPSKQ